MKKILKKIYDIFWLVFGPSITLTIIPLAAFFYLIIMAIKEWKKDSEVLEKHIGIEDEMQKKFKAELDKKFRN